MKVKIAVILLVVAAVAVALTLYFYPQARPAPGAGSQPPPAAVQPVARVLSPVQTVTSYIQALEDRKYETAYGLLTEESQQKHSYDEFVSQVEKTGVTDYDLSTARAEEQGEGAVVEVQLKEDPSSAGFHLVKEKNAWRIAYREGTPSFPYP
jgi:hypothetical protein